MFELLNVMHSEHSRRFLGLVAFIHSHRLRVVLVSAIYVDSMPCSYASIHRDNLWPIVTSLILTPVVSEFGFDGPWLKLGQNIGLLVGAAFWGVASDVWGRQYVHSKPMRPLADSSFFRWAFNITLFITGVFALAAGASPGFVALCSLAAIWSIGVGGNLPVDSAVFLGEYSNLESIIAAYP